jgi:hypothetical protein
VRDGGGVSRAWWVSTTSPSAPDVVNLRQLIYEISVARSAHVYQSVRLDVASRTRGTNAMMISRDQEVDSCFVNGRVYISLRVEMNACPELVEAGARL